MTVDPARRALLSGAAALAGGGWAGIATGQPTAPGATTPKAVSRAARLQVPPGRSNISRRGSSSRACAGGGSRRSNSPIT